MRKTCGAIPCSVDQLTRSRKDRGHEIVHISSRRIRARGKIERDDRFDSIRSEARSQTGTRNVIEIRSMKRCIVVFVVVFNLPKRQYFSLCYRCLWDALWRGVSNTFLTQCVIAQLRCNIDAIFLLFAIIFEKYCNIDTLNKRNAHGIENRASVSMYNCWIKDFAVSFLLRSWSR